MPVIVGLGNIGKEYDGTRHNIGFDVVDAIAEKLSATFKKGNGPYYLASGSHRGTKLLLAKPTTFMNLSGKAVKSILGYHKIPVEDCLVCTDDINLPVAKLRIRAKGGAGGHNGLTDIIDSLNTDRFPRLRFGVGNDFPKGRQADFVLSPFDNTDSEAVAETVKRSCDAALCFAREGINRTMNLFN